MATPASEGQLKEAIKSALPEVLAENPELFRGIIEDVVEEIGLAQAIREGLETDPVDEEEVRRILGETS
ncbi:MAG: hypothetical protein HUU46_11165 [Candidatus Hydrogenedentes bacterium]|nr:hypothetical protein [Candidatus Hydrogenedentota bacterium]